MKNLILSAVFAVAFGCGTVLAQGFAVKLGYKATTQWQNLAVLSGESAFSDNWSLQGEFGFGFGYLDNVSVLYGPTRGRELLYHLNVEGRRYLLGQRGFALSGLYAGPTLQANYGISKWSNQPISVYEGFFVSPGAVVGYQYALGAGIRIDGAVALVYSP